MWTPKKVQFCKEYRIDRNATQAAIRCGYSAKSARVQGSRLLTDVDIAREITSWDIKQSEKLEITAERIQAEYAKLAFSDARKAVAWRTNVLAAVENDDGSISRLVQNQVVVVDSADLDDDTACAISEVSQGKDGQIKLKFYDKKGALDSLARIKGMFKDTLEIGGSVSFVIEGAPEAG